MTRFFGSFEPERQRLRQVKVRNKGTNSLHRLEYKRYKRKLRKIWGNAPEIFRIATSRSKVSFDKQKTRETAKRWFLTLVISRVFFAEITSLLSKVYFPWVNEIIDPRKLQVTFRGSIISLTHG